MLADSAAASQGESRLRPRPLLTLTHLRLVLPYGDDIQRRLLLQALAEDRNTRQLEQAVRAIRPSRGKGGRPRLPRDDMGRAGPDAVVGGYRSRAEIQAVRGAGSLSAARGP
ncbi:MAG: hypothetical protein R3F65_18365 [bacterium]